MKKNIIVLFLFFIGCGVVPSELVIKINSPVNMGNSKEEFYPKSFSSVINSADDPVEIADKIEVEFVGPITKKINLKGGKREYRITSLPAGKYLVRLIVYLENRIIAWGENKNVFVENGKIKHTTIILTYQKEWE